MNLRALMLTAAMALAVPATASAQSGPAATPAGNAAGCPSQLKACTALSGLSGGAAAPDETLPGLVQDQATVPGSAPGGRGARRGRGLALLDANGDGVISEAEWLSGRGRLFERLDTNGDGVISRDEVAAMAAARQASGRPAGRHRASPDRLFQRLDANGDGVISRAEFDAAGRTMFGRLDRNGDGVLTAEELPHGRGAR